MSLCRQRSCVCARFSHVRWPPTGTEEDKINCPFYFKIGSCRHGDRCSRNHMRPLFSQTLLIPHMYAAPPPGPDGRPVVDERTHFDDFYEEIIEELGKVRASRSRSLACAVLSPWSQFPHVHVLFSSGAVWVS